MKCYGMGGWKDLEGRVEGLDNFQPSNLPVFLREIPKQKHFQSLLVVVARVLKDFLMFACDIVESLFRRFDFGDRFTPIRLADL